MKAEFFYRNPLKKGEPKPAFGVKEPDPDRPDHKGFMKEVFNAREEDHSLTESGFILLNHKSSITDFYDDKEVTEIYYDEMANLVKKQTGAAQVFIVSHITRNEAEAFDTRVQLEVEPDARMQIAPRHSDHSKM